MLKRHQQLPRKVGYRDHVRTFKLFSVSTCSTRRMYCLYHQERVLRGPRHPAPRSPPLLPSLRPWPGPQGRLQAGPRAPARILPISLSILSGGPWALSPHPCQQQLPETDPLRTSLWPQLLPHLICCPSPQPPPAILAVLASAPGCVPPAPATLYLGPHPSCSGAP